MSQEVIVILLYVAGMALIVSEIFLPGVVMGLIGLGCVIAGLYMAFYWESGVLAWSLVGISVVSIPVLIVLWLKVFNRVLAMKFTQAGYTGAQVEYKELVGQEGVALTQLRPAGMARFGDRKVDVVSEGEVVDRDSRVRVVEVKGNRVVVRAVKS